jgi:5-methylcytosine-specific restriction endonuclease McrA
MKTCKVCSAEKPSDQFDLNRRTCKYCRAEKERAVYASKRESEAAYARQRYHLNVEYNRGKTARYKACNPESVSRWGRTRYERIKVGADSLSEEQISELKREARSCAYCDASISDSEKQTDHILPLSLGGDHSERNVVIVCRPCNGAKSAVHPGVWLNRLSGESRARVASLCGERSVPFEVIGSF